MCLNCTIMRIMGFGVTSGMVGNDDYISTTNVMFMLHYILLARHR